MTALVAAATALVIVGVLVVGGGLAGLRWNPRVRPRRRLPALSSAMRIRLGIGLVIGIAASLATGITVLVLLVPVLVGLLPVLFGRVGHPDVDLLENLDRWVRLLTAAVATGKSVPDAIRSTRAQVPAALVGPVSVLLDRLDARWSVRDALAGLADDLDSADADAICAALTLIAERGGVGASTTLEALASHVQVRLHALREINAERAKPQMVVRQVTLITIGGLGLVVLMSPSYFHEYTTPVGQVLVVTLTSAYLGSLLMLRHMAAPVPRARILLRSSSEVTVDA